MFLHSLESRRLCSVTVHEGFPGFFEISGDEADNQITVDVDPDAATFTIDNQTYQGLLQLSVYGKGGSDMIWVNSPHGSFITASIDGGDGDDILSLNLDGAIRGGPGNDRIYMRDSYLGEVYGEAGDDYIILGGDNGNPIVDGGAGDDWIDASTNNFKVDIHGGDGTVGLRQVHAVASVGCAGYADQRRHRAGGRVDGRVG